MSNNKTMGLIKKLWSALHTFIDFKLVISLAVISVNNYIDCSLFGGIISYEL